MSVGVLALLAMCPVVIIFLLLIVFKVPTHWTAIIGWVVTVVFAMVFFNTNLEACLVASLHGVVSSLGITLLILATVLMCSFMEETGALDRITTWVKTLSPDDEATQAMIIGNGTGTVLVSIGATPASILPPVFKGLGYKDFLCVALSIVGFLGLDAYGMLAICMVVVCSVTGMDLVALNKIVVMFLPAASIACAFMMLYLINGWKMCAKGAGAALVAGVSGSAVCILIAYTPALQGAILLSGIFGGIAVVLCEMLYLKVRGFRLFDESCLNEQDRKNMDRMSLVRALSPWLILVVLLCATNFITPLYDFLYTTLKCPVEVIPGKAIAVRPLWNAYTWAFVSIFLSALFIKPSKEQWKGTFKKFGQRWLKPTIAVCGFYALGILINNTGIDPSAGWKIVDPNNNMISVMAQASADLLGAAYPVIVAPLTVFGAFVTSSQTSACVMYSNYFIQAGQLLDMNAYVFVAIAVIAGGIAGVISPAKLLNASAVIGADGADQVALKKVFAPTVAVILLMVVVTFVGVAIYPPVGI